MKKQTQIMIAPLLFVTSVTSLQAATPVAEICKKLFNTGKSDQALAPCIEAANNNDRASQTTLGEIYDEKGDSANTLHWWQQAADADYQPARNLLALKYYYGGTVFGPQEGWNKDLKKAFEIWHKDAKAGTATSQFMVGVMYQKGKGVEVNQSESWYWLQLALGNGYKTATDVLIELSREITPEQKRLGEQKVATYKKKNSASIAY